MVLQVLANSERKRLLCWRYLATKWLFDWRQMQRWGISASSLPAGSEIRFRDPTLWEQYRTLILVVLAVLLLQGALIAWLIYEHRRRQIAELVSMQRMNELARMNRFATAGELSASIAHEIKQPLAAIIAYGSAGLRWLAKQTPNVEEAREVLKKIVDESGRSSRIIDDIRAMFRKDIKPREYVDVNALISETLPLIEHELKTQEVYIQTSLSEVPAPHTFADRVQLKQVLLNLMINAIEAMSSVVSGRRVLAVSSSADQNGVLITVEDSGPGYQRRTFREDFRNVLHHQTRRNGHRAAHVPVDHRVSRRTASDVDQSPRRLHVPSLFAELDVDSPAFLGELKSAPTK